MANSIFDQILENKNNGIDQVLVTVVEKDGSGPADVGKKMLVDIHGNALGTVGGGSLEYYARNKCIDIIKARKTISEKYLLSEKGLPNSEDEIVLPMACGGHVTLFYEFIGPRAYVYIFGAGHCSQALVKALKPLGFYVTVIDEREEVIKALTDADKKVCSKLVDYINEHGISNDSYVVVSTPSHVHDFAVLDLIIEKNIKPKYFGMVCSKKKINEYLDRVHEKYGNDINLDHLYSPIGLLLGGDSPEEIAISISSEMLAIYYNKSEIKHMRETLNDNACYWKK